MFIKNGISQTESEFRHIVSQCGCYIVPQTTISARILRPQFFENIRKIENDWLSIWIHYGPEREPNYFELSLILRRVTLCFHIMHQPAIINVYIAKCYEFEPCMCFYFFTQNIHLLKHIESQCLRNDDLKLMEYYRDSSMARIERTTFTGNGSSRRMKNLTDQQGLDETNIEVANHTVIK